MGWWFAAQYVAARWRNGPSNIAELHGNVRAQFRLLREAVAHDESAFGRWWPLTELPPLDTCYHVDVQLADFWHCYKHRHGVSSVRLLRQRFLHNFLVRRYRMCHAPRQEGQRGGRQSNDHGL